MQINIIYIFKSLFLPRVAEFIYIEGANKRVNFCESIVIDWWGRKSPRNYSLDMNKIYNSSRKHTLLLSPSIIYIYTIAHLIVSQNKIYRYILIHFFNYSCFSFVSGKSFLQYNFNSIVMQIKNRQVLLLFYFSINTPFILPSFWKFLYFDEIIRKLLFKPNSSSNLSCLSFI